MRPLRVGMQAFGPYAGEQTLDFAELRGASFFLITGPTGSGKTTVLDAMSFALYGVTSGGPENEGGRSGAAMRSDHADPELLTRVTFDFALGAERFRIVREPEQERPKLKGHGVTKHNQTATLWRLRDGDGALRSEWRAPWRRLEQGQRQVGGAPGLPLRAVPPGRHAPAGPLPEAAGSGFQGARADPPSAVRHGPLRRARAGAQGRGQGAARRGREAWQLSAPKRCARPRQRARRTWRSGATASRLGPPRRRPTPASREGARRSAAAAAGRPATPSPGWTNSPPPRPRPRRSPAAKSPSRPCGRSCRCGRAGVHRERGGLLASRRRARSPPSVAPPRRREDKRLRRSEAAARGGCRTGGRRGRRGGPRSGGRRGTAAQGARWRHDRSRDGAGGERRGPGDRGRRTRRRGCGRGRLDGGPRPRRRGRGSMARSAGGEARGGAGNGEPCPVCGSTDHPSPASLPDETPGQDEVEALRNAADLAFTARDEATQRLVAAEASSAAAAGAGRGAREDRASRVHRSGGAHRGHRRRRGEVGGPHRRTPEGPGPAHETATAVATARDRGGDGGRRTVQRRPGGRPRPAMHWPSGSPWRTSRTRTRGSRPAASLTKSSACAARSPPTPTRPRAPPSACAWRALPPKGVTAPDLGDLEKLPPPPRRRPRSPRVPPPRTLGARGGGGPPARAARRARPRGGGRARALRGRRPPRRRRGRRQPPSPLVPALRARARSSTTCWSRPRSASTS